VLSGKERAPACAAAVGKTVLRSRSDAAAPTASGSFSSAWRPSELATEPSRVSYRQLLLILSLMLLFVSQFLELDLGAAAEG
jgi:hypothetical protein